MIQNKEQKPTNMQHQTLVSWSTWTRRTTERSLNRVMNTNRSIRLVRRLKTLTAAKHNRRISVYP